MGYKVIFDGYEHEKVYATYEAAEEAAWQMQDEFNAGSELLYEMNPGDYEEEMDGATDNYEIIEV